MISFNDFVEILKTAGSDMSTDLNKLLKGVNGMPVTHQVGFGAAWRKGIHPDNVDVKKMNRETHDRMWMVGFGFAGGAMLVKQKHILTTIAGVFLAGSATKELMELYKDWQAGFQAARCIGHWYTERMTQKRRLLLGNSPKIRKISMTTRTIQRPFLLGNHR